MVSFWRFRHAASTFIFLPRPPSNQQGLVIYSSPSSSLLRWKTSPFIRIHCDLADAAVAIFFVFQTRAGKTKINAAVSHLTPHCCTTHAFTL